MGHLQRWAVGQLVLWGGAALGARSRPRGAPGRDVHSCEP